MNKLALLRDHLLNSPLRIKAAKLLTFAEQGSIHYHRHETDHSFLIRFKANIIITDFTGDFNSVTFILLQWLNDHQPDMKPDALKFHVDILDQKKSDLSFVVELSEHIKSAQVDGGHTLESDPLPDPLKVNMYHD